MVSELGETPLDAIEKHLKLEPMDAPDVSTLAADDVLIGVKRAAVGWVDLIMTSGQYQHMAKPPYTPGLEFAGVVLWKGKEASAAPAVGANVLVDPFLAGPRSLGAHQRWGGFASYAVAPARAALEVPGSLSLDEACNLLGNYETAYHCLIARGRLQAGETVLIHGATGSTGLAAVQVAKKVGATVIATGRNAAKLEIVKQHGADHALVTSAEGFDLRTEVKALTAGRGVDVVYDGVGGDISAESLRCVRFGARFLVVGWAATPFVSKGKGERGAPNANQLPTNLIMMKGVDVLGCPTAISTGVDPSIRPPRLRQVLAWAAAGDIAPYISHRFAFDDWKAAMLAKWRGAVIGGAVLQIAE